MKKSNILLLILVAILSVSCAFDKNFLRPITFKKDLQKLVVNKTVTDSMIIRFSIENHQPSFFDKNNQPISLQYIPESTLFKSSNGYLLHGWMMRPENGVAKATLIHFHGNGSNLLYQMKFVLPLVKKGYQVFIFDYSGFGFSEGKATRKQLLVDGEDAINYVKSRTDVHNMPVFIHGMSYGGNLALCVAAKMQNKIDGVVTEGAFSSHKDLASNGNRKKFMTRLFIKEIYASEKYVSQIKKPLLIIHSQDDTVIPFVNAERIYANATATKKEFLKVKGKHLEASADDLNKIDSAIMNMIQ
jgi:fermentation-respiration switch protein FrsA (DUF1100 family)